MKKNSITIRAIAPVLIVSSFIVLGSCKGKTSREKEVTGEDVKKEFREAVDTTAAYLSEERKQMINSYEKRIKNAEQQIAALKDKTVSAGETVQQEYRERIRTLESSVAGAKEDIIALKSSSKEAWGEFQEGVKAALEDLDQAIEDAKNEFKQQ